ncbi:MAG TPA: PadR family transcriptional regulator [Acidimicrobiales bacterium]|nr:PadR family transcriptional regulator [Acidimicrobiales bacterium]
MSAVLEMAVLGLLKEQELHGYELKKRLSDVFGFSTGVSFGSLYPALARLESAGAVQVIAGGTVAEQPEDAAQRERRAGRRRKVYAITPLGAKMFEELLAGSQGSTEDDRSFSLRLAFASYLPPERRLGLLLQRRAVLGERLAQLAARARARRDDRYMRVLYQRQTEELSSNVSWLDQLIQEERESGDEAGRWGANSAERRGDRASGQVAAGARSVSRWLRGEPRRLVPLASASQLRRAVPGQIGNEQPTK